MRNGVVEADVDREAFAWCDVGLGEFLLVPLVALPAAPARFGLVPPAERVVYGNIVGSGGPTRRQDLDGELSGSLRTLFLWEIGQAKIRRTEVRPMFRSRAISD